MKINETENSASEKLLGVILVWKLNFNDNIFDACKKAGGKLNASARVALFIG